MRWQAVDIGSGRVDVRVVVCGVFERSRAVGTLIRWAMVGLDGSRWPQLVVVLVGSEESNIAPCWSMA